VDHLIRRRPHATLLVAGVDGGGTGTRAVIMDSEKRVVGEGQAGPSNPLRVGIATAATVGMATALFSLGAAAVRTFMLVQQSTYALTALTQSAAIAGAAWSG